MIDIAASRARFEALEPVVDERGRRLFAASEACAAGHGGVVAVSQATGLARSTIDRGLADLRSGVVMFSTRVRRHGGGCKPATETQPALLETLNEAVQSSIRGDPEAALLWVSKSQRQRHLPPGTSKWNRIEHKLFAFITMNWRGKPLVSYLVIVQLIASTATDTGLTVVCQIDANAYEKGIKVSDAEMASLNARPDAVHGEWNYTIAPRRPDG